MAYIIQHRRDTIENWIKVNQILADAEIGFVLAKGSSMYKIGDGVTAWNDLPMFGFGGNFYDNFDGNDLDTSVPSRRVVLASLQEITHGSEKMEGLLDKLSTKQLVHMISPDPDVEDFEGISPEDEATVTMSDVEPTLRKQVVSRWAILEEFQQIWNDFGSLEDSFISLKNEDLKVLQDFAEKYGPIVDSNVTALATHSNTLGEHATKLEEHTAELEEHTTTLESHASYIDANTKYITGFDEIRETGETDPETGEPITETIHHKGIDERFEDVNNSINSKHVILSKTEYNNIKGDLLTTYPEGTIFMVYEDEE